VAHVADRPQADPAAPAATEVRDTPLWHSQAHMPTVRRSEVVVERGEGAYVWDESGRKLLDAPAALWFCNVGHGRAEIAEAVAAQMSKLAAYSSFQQYATRPAIALAERLVAMVPMPNAKVFLGSGGSDAVDTAAKLSRRYWEVSGQPEKKIIVTRELAYHGLHGFGTSLTGIEANRAGYGPHMPDTARVEALDAGALRELIEREGAERVAAFFCEPVIGSGGIFNPPAGYLEEVREICRAYDVLFVADEVITGFGRTGAMFACDRYGIEPDLMLMAKGITSGYLPLGAAVVSERVWEPFWREGGEIFRHGLTYSGHASVCAAAHANLDILEREQLVARVAELEPVLHEAIQPLAKHELVRAVRSGVGLLAGVDPVEAPMAHEVARICTENGVLMRIAGERTLMISPPFVITADELRHIAATLEAAFDTVAGC
jgi:adenosylmethionine-8-amino-7-oxononanoate aminotransferase